jgi:hypothetical protein
MRVGCLTPHRSCERSAYDRYTMNCTSGAVFGTELSARLGGV